jgi:hypothetical protein
VKSSRGAAIRSATKRSQYRQYRAMFAAISVCSAADGRPQENAIRLPHQLFSSSTSSAGNPISVKIMYAGSG